MTSFAGTIASGSVYPAASGLEGGALDSRVVSAFPYTTGYMTSGKPSGAWTTNLPLATAHGAKVGVRATSFALTDWYYRIHVTPALMALGNVVSNVTQSVGVWNAWLETAQTLNAINGVNVDGINLAGGGMLPQVFAPNQEVRYTVTVSTEGPPTIAGTYTWQFADSENVTLTVTGNRISAWALTPDWAQPVVERIEYKTDILQSWSGIEQRRALRIAPRRTIEFDAQLWRQDRRFIEAVLFAWSSRVWALPIWPDGQKLTADLLPGATAVPCDTVNRDFVAGGLAALISDAGQYEVLQVLTVSSTSIGLAHPTANKWPNGSKLYPARSARLTSYPKITRDNGEYASAKPSFVIVEPCDWPAATGLPSYRGYPVLEMAPDEGAGSDSTYEREAVTMDNDTGTITVDDRARIGFPVLSHAWFMQGRATRAAFRSLMYMLKGRQGVMWVPTYNADLILAASVTAGQPSIDVELTGAALYLSGQRNRRDIRVELMNGSLFYRRVTGAVALDSNTERLTLDSSLGVNISPSQVRRISYMAPCRLNSDSIEIQHHTAADGLATAVTPWRAVGDDL
jgi:predicted hotdog family 3-hydroxylacyl-ACP dehydratase